MRLVVNSIQLFFLLILSVFSKKFFDYAWKKYYTTNLPKSVFNLCVQWLLYTGRQLNLSYEKINVLIFCVIWPVITISSIVLNIVLLVIIL